MAGGTYRTSATVCLAVCEKVVRHFENISLVHRHEVTSNTEAVKKEIPALHMDWVAQRETKDAATKFLLRASERSSLRDPFVENLSNKILCDHIY